MITRAERARWQREHVGLGGGDHCEWCRMLAAIDAADALREAGEALANAPDFAEAFDTWNKAYVAWRQARDRYDAVVEKP